MKIGWGREKGGEERDREGRKEGGKEGRKGGRKERNGWRKEQRKRKRRKREKETQRLGQAQEIGTVARGRGHRSRAAAPNNEECLFSVTSETVLNHPKEARAKTVVASRSDVMRRKLLHGSLLGALEGFIHGAFKQPGLTMQGARRYQCTAARSHSRPQLHIRQSQAQAEQWLLFGPKL
jgi:hypothetical protein